MYSFVTMCSHRRCGAVHMTNKTIKPASLLAARLCHNSLMIWLLHHCAVWLHSEFKREFHLDSVLLRLYVYMWCLFHSLVPWVSCQTPLASWNRWERKNNDWPKWFVTHSDLTSATSARLCASVWFCCSMQRQREKVLKGKTFKCRWQEGENLSWSLAPGWSEWQRQ